MFKTSLEFFGRGRVICWRASICSLKLELVHSWTPAMIFMQWSELAFLRPAWILRSRLGSLPDWMSLLASPIQMLDWSWVLLTKQSTKCPFFSDFFGFWSLTEELCSARIMSRLPRQSPDFYKKGTVRCQLHFSSGESSSDRLVIITIIMMMESLVG